jgi:hypothetical protein
MDPKMSLDTDGVEVFQLEKAPLINTGGSGSSPSSYHMISNCTTVTHS